MTAINHAVTGALIAAVVPYPIIALPVALASHFALDSLPHFDYGKKSLKEFFTTFTADGILILIFFLILFMVHPRHWELLATAAFVAMSPDLMWAPNGIRRLKGKPTKALGKIISFHKRIQTGERRSGLAIEIPYLIIFSYLLFLVERY